MIKRGLTLIAALMLVAPLSLGGCDKEQAEFREVPEEGPPAAADMADPAAPDANAGDNIAPPPPPQD